MFARPRIKCNDGFSMSVQDGEQHYAVPGETSEVGFPSEIEELLMPYVEDHENPLDTVYPHVPNNIVDKIIEKHGGYDNGKD